MSLQVRHLACRVTNCWLRVEKFRFQSGGSHKHHVSDWLVASVRLVFLGKDFAARHETHSNEIKVHWHVLHGCTFTNLTNSLKWIFLQRYEKHGWHFADIFLNKSNVERRNTLGCLNQSSTPNSKYTGGECSHPGGWVPSPHFPRYIASECPNTLKNKVSYEKELEWDKDGLCIYSDGQIEPYYVNFSKTESVCDIVLIKNEIECQSQFNQALEKILTMLRCILVQIWKY